MRISAGDELKRGLGYPVSSVLRCECECAIESGDCFGVTSKLLIAARQLLQRNAIPRIQFSHALKIANALIPAPLAAVDVGGQTENIWSVWQSFLRERDF